jgi:acetyl esterase/lipase
MKACINLFAILIILFLFERCKPGAPPERKYHRDTSFVFKNLRYGPDTLNFLDLYLPAKRGKHTPVVMTIHGGGWVVGDKSHFNSEYAVAFHAQGMIVVNINYRLITKGVTYKTILTDVKSAVEFIKRNSEKYSIDEKKINLVGYSAGAHIALLYAYRADTANDIRAVVSHWGPTNINDLKFKKVVDSVWNSSYLFPALLGEKFVLNSKEAIACSPIYHLENKPTLLIHGTKDELVPVEQSMALNDSLKAKGIKHFMILMPDHGHHGPNGIYSDSVKKTVQNWLFN